MIVFGENSSRISSQPGAVPGMYLKHMNVIKLGFGDVTSSSQQQLYQHTHTNTDLCCAVFRLNSFLRVEVIETVVNTMMCFSFGCLS